MTCRHAVKPRARNSRWLAARSFALSFQYLAKESFGSLGIAPALHQNIEYGAVLVDGPPEIVDLSLDSDEHFIGVPMITELTFPAFEAPLVARAELQAPTADRLLGNDDTALC